MCQILKFLNAGLRFFFIGKWLFVRALTSRELEDTSQPWVLFSLYNNLSGYFVNLKDGDTKKRSFVARFGSSMWGLVPAEKTAENTAGHAEHVHLLINQARSLDFKKLLFFSDEYIHFSKGQMEMVIDLSVGSYDLRPEHINNTSGYRIATAVPPLMWVVTNQLDPGNITFALNIST